MSKYYYLKGDGFNVGYRNKVVDEKGLRELFLQEEIECLKNSIGDKESMEINFHYVKNAMEDRYILEDVQCYLMDFGYTIKEIDEKTFFQFMSISETSYERSIRTNIEDKKEYIAFLKDVVKTMEDNLKLQGIDIN